MLKTEELITFINVASGHRIIPVNIRLNQS